MEQPTGNKTALNQFMMKTTGRKWISSRITLTSQSQIGCVTVQVSFRPKWLEQKGGKVPLASRCQISHPNRFFLIPRDHAQDHLSERECNVHYFHEGPYSEFSFYVFQLEAQKIKNCQIYHLFSIIFRFNIFFKNYKQL